MPGTNSQSGRLLPLGPIIGATASTSARIWIGGAQEERGLRVECARDADFSEIAGTAELNLSSDHDYTATCELQDLTPSTKYFCRVMEGDARVDMLSDDDK